MQSPTPHSLQPEGKADNLPPPVHVPGLFSQLRKHGPQTWRKDQKPCTPGHVLQSARVPTAPGLFTTAPAGHTRLMCCEMLQGDESKHVIVVNEHKDAAGKASTNPIVQCVYCDKEFRGGATRVRGHLAHIQGCGVGLCQKVPEDVKEHFSQVHSTKLQAAEKKRKLSALDQLSRSSSAAIEGSQQTLSQSCGGP